MISFKSLSFQNYHELVNLAQTSFLAKIIKKKKQYLLMHAANNINATCPVNDSYEHSKQELLIMKS